MLAGMGVEGVRVWVGDGRVWLWVAAREEDGWEELDPDDIRYPYRGGPLPDPSAALPWPRPPYEQ